MLLGRTRPKVAIPGGGESAEQLRGRVSEELCYIARQHRGVSAVCVMKIRIAEMRLCIF